MYYRFEMCKYEVIVTDVDGVRHLGKVKCGGPADCMRLHAFSNRGLINSVQAQYFCEINAYVDNSECEKDANPVEKGLTN